MYIRFQGQRRSDRSASRLGIFQLAFELRDEGDLEKFEEAELLENLEWLRMHLKSPKILKEDAHYRAISWFTPNANEPIKRIRNIQRVLENHGYHIDQVKTRDPGMIIYRDGFQVVAKPR